MKYRLFVTLYQEALNCSTVDHFIVDRSWQDWMNEYEVNGDAGKIASFLQSIYYLANTPLKEIRESKQISRVSFASLYDIPVRTVENWESGTRQIPEYTMMLIAFTFFTNDLLK